MINLLKRNTRNNLTDFKIILGVQVLYESLASAINRKHPPKTLQQAKGFDACCIAGAGPTKRLSIGARAKTSQLQSFTLKNCATILVTERTRRSVRIREILLSVPP